MRDPCEETQHKGPSFDQRSRTNRTQSQRQARLATTAPLLPVSFKRPEADCWYVREGQNMGLLKNTPALS